MLSVILGLVFMILGLWGLLSWWADFVVVFKGSVPVLIFMGGLLAVIAGITSIRDSMQSKSSSPSTDTAKDEKTEKN